MQTLIKEMEQEMKINKVEVVECSCYGCVTMRHQCLNEKHKLEVSESKIPFDISLPITHD